MNNHVNNALTIEPTNCHQTDSLVSLTVVLILLGILDNVKLELTLATNYYCSQRYK